MIKTEKRKKELLFILFILKIIILIKIKIISKMYILNIKLYFISKLIFQHLIYIFIFIIYIKNEKKHFSFIFSVW
jgi:hypothetical protein